MQEVSKPEQQHGGGRTAEQARQLRGIRPREVRKLQSQIYPGFLPMLELWRFGPKWQDLANSQCIHNRPF